MSDAIRPSRSGRIGMPTMLWLQGFALHVRAAFGHPPYLVGSALRQMMGTFDGVPHDIDVRMILNDDEYESWGLGDPLRPHENAKWVALVLAFSELGRAMTGLPIDFQIQQRTAANRDSGPRSGLGVGTAHAITSDLEQVEEDHLEDGGVLAP